MATRSRKDVLILILLSLAQLMIVLDFSIVNVALPSIQAQFGLTPTSLQWVVSAYALTYGGFLLLGGRASDVFGRKRIFLAGLVTFSVASLTGGLAISAVSIFLSRAVQGLGAAMLAPSALSFVTTLYREGTERTWALSIFSSMAAIGFTTGVILGGILTSTLSWNWVFFVNVPIGMAVFGTALFLLPHQTETREKGFDVTGAVLVTTSVIAIIYAITRFSVPGESYLEIGGLLILSLILMISFLWVEDRACIPLVPLNIFRRRTILVSDLVMFLTFVANAGLVFIITLFLQEVRGFSPLETGLIFLPAGLGGLTGAFSANRIINRIGFRNTMVVGLILFGIGIGGLTTIGINSSIYELMVFYYLGALGLVAGIVSMNIGGTTGVAARRQGLAAGLITTSQQIGAAIGVSTASVILAGVSLIHGVSPAVRVTGYRDALWLSEGMVLVAIALGLYLVRRVRRREKLQKEGKLPPDPGPQEGATEDQDGQCRR